MTASMLLELFFKSLIVSGVALVLLELLKGRSAAERSWVGHAGLVGLLLLPLGSMALPSWRIDFLAEHIAPRAAEGGLPSAPIMAASAVAAAPTAAAQIDVQILLTLVYVAGAGALLMMTLVGIVRLFALQMRSAVLVDADWLTALARAQQRMGLKYGAALLVSSEINSPISWGMMRPIILLNEKVIPLRADAEAIIAHELAHVIRFDWAKLLAARAVTAMCWFNPLVWILARQCHQLREEAADDAVLRSDVPSADYAALLVGAARHECKALLLAAHGMAPSRSSLGQRVMKVLDDKRRRVPAPAAWAICCLAGATFLAGPLSAFTLERERVVKRDIVATASDQQREPLRQHSSTPAPPQAIGLNRVLASERRVAPASDPAAARDVAAVQGPPAPVVARARVEAPTSGESVGAAEPPDVNPLPADFGQRLNDTLLGKVDAAELRSLAQAGYTDRDEQAALNVLGVTPAYIAELASAGYGDLSADDLAAFKALGISAAFIRSAQRPGEPKLTPEEMFERRALSWQ